MRTLLLSLASVACIAFVCLHRGESAGPLKPPEAHAQFKTPDDPCVDLVLAEPVVRQPVFLPSAPWNRKREGRGGGLGA